MTTSLQEEEKLIDDKFSKENLTKLFQNDKAQFELFTELGYVEEISKKIDVNINTGLDNNDQTSLNARKEKYGDNSPVTREPKTLLDFIMEPLEDKMLQTLLVASVVSLAIGIWEEGLETGWIEGTAIFMAVFVVVSITAVNNYQKEQQFIKLSLENSKKDVYVRRNGADKSISVYDIVVGDILKVEEGCIFPVDGIIIDGSIEVDESAMTGESLILTKKPYVINSELSEKINPFCISGTTVKTGKGYIMVCAVGKNSFLGKNKEALNADTNELTPLQEKLETLADQIGDFGIYSAVLIGSAIIVKEFIIRLYYGREIFNTSFLDTFLNAAIIAITVIVVAIPEGLPMAVTISLAYSVFKMKDENNLVRRIEAGETMGGVDTICSDKTGTLTYGEMEIDTIFIEENDFPKGKYTDLSKLNSWKDLVRAMFVNQEAIIKTEKENGKDVEKIVGNMTDCAMLKFLKSNNIKLSDYEKNEKKLGILPFKSDYKFMATLSVNESHQNTIFLKGAPEFLIDKGRVSHYCAKNGAELRFDDQAKMLFKNKQKEFAEASKRTILILKKNIEPEIVENYNDTKIESWDVNDQLMNFTIIAMVGIYDRPRDNIQQVLENLKKDSKINVRMVTGDNIDTAIAISREIKILSESQYFVARNFIIEKDKSEKKIKELKNSINVKIQEDKSLDEKESDKKYKILKEIEKLKEDLLKEETYLKQFESTHPLFALTGEDFRRLCGGLKEVEKTKEEIEDEKKKMENDGSDENNTNDKKNKKQINTKKIVLADETQFKNTTEFLKVIARASPQDKYLMVLGLKQLGSVVAVTGDGTNDAPALKVSDVGFAMGKRGTDVAKDACDIVLLEESFESIVTAVKYGRNVFDCIRKFLQFQLTTNVVAVFMTFLGAIVLKDAPLNAIQMLWLNLIMDSFGSLALATEPPKQDLLKRKPYKRTEHPITSMMYFNIISQATFQILVLTIILFYGDVIFNVPSDRELSHFEWNNYNGYHFTIFFHIFVLMQIFNSINARKLKKTEVNVFEDITNNKMYIIIQSTILVCQILMIQFGGRALRVKSLSFIQHFFCILIASISLLVGYVCKKLPISFEFDEESEEKKSFKDAMSRVPLRKSFRKSDVTQSAV